MTDLQLEPPRQLTLHKRLPRLVSANTSPAFGETSTNVRGQLPLAEYWYVLRKRRWTILAVVVLLTAITAVLSSLMTPMYEATARLEIEPETPLLQSQSSSDVYQKVDADDVFLQTQIQLLKSDTLAWQTIEQLNLAQHLGGISAQGVPQDSDGSKVQLIGAFNSRLKVEQVAKTRMLSVSFQDPDPKVAAQVATRLVNDYVEYNFPRKR